MVRDTRELVQQTAAGDVAALQELVRRYLPGLRAFIRLRMHSALREKESSSDIAQSVCADLLRGLDRFDYRGERAFKAWLYSAALHKIQQHRRYHEAQQRDVRREMAQGDDPLADRELLQHYASFLTPSRDVAAREQLQRVEAAFDEMPEEYREVITLVKIAGLSRAEVAERMNRTEGSVRMLMHRAMARLSTLLTRS